MNVFRAFDEDRSGFLTPTEIRNILKKLDPTMTQEAVEDIVNSVDTDGDKQV